MAETKTKKKRTKRASGPSRRTPTPHSPSEVEGKHLVIVESPAKAKTINRYLGPDFVVEASVGHIRDLPTRSPKGMKQPVPGVDLENDFAPTYEVLPAKKKVVDRLKSVAKKAADIWFATDWDREGEAIAWHLAQELGIEPGNAKRVVFNAITKSEIERAFSNPHTIDEDMVNAQQARRILDRIVGYQVSPLLWKKVARGLSAGRVQSVAVRLVVEREQEIRKFVPDEYWKVTARFSADESIGTELAKEWATFMAQRDKKDKPPTLRDQNAWLAEHNSFKAELVELDSKKFELKCQSTQVRDLSKDMSRIAEAVGMTEVRVTATENPKGKGPERTLRTVEGRVDHATRYAVSSIETKRTTSRAPAPFITSTMQMAASSALGIGASRTMRLAQELYEGVNVKGFGQIGLITYMRTDSTHLSGEAIGQARSFVKEQFGERYLPAKAQFFSSSNKTAQEAHEAIRPTDVSLTPEKLRGKIKDSEHKLYNLIWKRFVACQMTPAEWDTTTVLLKRSDKDTKAVFKTTGRVLVFDGHYKVSGIPTASDEQTLPAVRDNQGLAPFDIQPQQIFTSPPPRYSEASLVKTLESEGIGRPSTYASIIQVIQDRGYVEQLERRFHATDLGEVVTDKLIEGFPRLMEVGYTRQMEEKLDQIEEQHKDWVTMLREFYQRFSESLEKAHELMTHAKAETQPAQFMCPKCGSRTMYRFGKNGRFLSCSAYPECDYAAPIDREGQPHLPERVNVACPEDGSPMILRTGRFGKFLASMNYPEIKCVVNLDKKGQIKYPSPPPVKTDLACEKCGSPLNLRRGKRGPWLGCSTFPKCRGRLAWNKLEEKKRQQLETELAEDEKSHPAFTLVSLDGTTIPEGTPVADLTMAGEIQRLQIHPEAEEKTEAA